MNYRRWLVWAKPEVEGNDASRRRDPLPRSPSLSEPRASACATGRAPAGLTRLLRARLGSLELGADICGARSESSVTRRCGALAL